MAGDEVAGERTVSSCFFFSSRRRHTRLQGDWSSDVCSSDLVLAQYQPLCVPAKLYESVALGTPTLVIAEPDSAAAREARRLGAMTVDAAEIGRASCRERV